MCSDNFCILALGSGQRLLYRLGSGIGLVSVLVLRFCALRPLFSMCPASAISYHVILLVYARHCHCLHFQVGEYRWNRWSTWNLSCIRTRITYTPRRRLSKPLLVLFHCSLLALYLPIYVCISSLLSHYSYEIPVYLTLLNANQCAAGSLLLEITFVVRFVMDHGQCIS